MVRGGQIKRLKRKMRVAISYPPLQSPHGIPLLAQNRQFQWFKSPTYIYPVVPAYAATMLKASGFNVLWDDAVARGLKYADWLEKIERERPDVIAIETKTPVVKRHWEIIKDLKRTGRLPGRPVVVLMGDHVTFNPQESMRNSPVDFVLTGGDYDFLLLSLCKALEKGWLPVMSDELEPGIWYREKKEVKSTGRFRLDHDLKELPPIDRELTDWRLYSRKNGNFKRLPGTYTMAGRDCWWAKCTFCSWTTLYPKYRVRTPGAVLDEVGELIERYGVKEIMDDTGTFPTGKWLRAFATGMIERGYNRKVFFDCNMRFGALKKGDYALLKKAGFRLLLFGLESGSQATLDRLNKGVTVEEVVESCTEARKAGLYPHITIMFGYPWEGPSEAEETVRLGRFLLKKGLAWTVQATVAIPYPGTPLYEYCKKDGLLAGSDWDSFDMRSPVMHSPIKEPELKRLVQRVYSTAFSPEFLLRRSLAIRDFDDVKYFLRAGGKVFGHLFDFNGKKKGARPSTPEPAKT